MDNPQIKELSDKAVDFALANNWKLAIELYKKILSVDKNNLDATLGLAFAYLQTNNIKDAKKNYKRHAKEELSISDRIFLSAIHRSLEEGTKAMDDMLFRTAFEKLFFQMQRALIHRKR